MRIIKDESELPFPATRLVQEFIRSLAAPAFLIETNTGEVFKREDGKFWKQPAYHRSAKLNESSGYIAVWDDLEPRGAWFDDKVYPYEAKAAA